MAADVATFDAAKPHQLTLTVGTCKLELYTPDTKWTKEGTKYKNTAKAATLRLPGKTDGMPLLSPVAFVVDNTKFSLSLKDTVPLPKSELFTVLSPALGMIPDVSMGIDTGANIEAKAPDLMLQDDKTYLYFLSNLGLSIDLNKKDANSPNTSKGSAPSIGLQPIFALDPCDPAIFLGGASVTVDLVTVTLSAIGFSLKGAIDFVTGSKFWRGVNTSGSPVYEPFTMQANAYLKGGVSVGLGKYAALSFNGLVGLAITSTKDVVTQAIRLVQKGEIPTGNFKLAIEGEKSITLLDKLEIPFEGGGGALDVTRNGTETTVKMMVMGTKGPKLSLDDLIGGFGVKIPGVESLEAGSDVQIHTYVNAKFTGDFANPTFKDDSTEFGVLLKGDLYAAGQKLAGSVQLKYKKSTNKFSACMQIPFVDELQCGNVCIKDSDCSGTKACVFGVCAAKLPDGAPCYSNTQCTSGKCMIACGATTETYVAAASEVKGSFDQLGKDIEVVLVQIGQDLDQAAKAMASWTTHQIGHAAEDSNKCAREAEDLGRLAASSLLSHAVDELPQVLATAAARASRIPASQRMAVTRGTITTFIDTYAGKLDSATSSARTEVQNWRLLTKDQDALKARVTDAARAKFAELKPLAWEAWHRRFNAAHFGGEIQLKRKADGQAQTFIATPTHDGAYYLTDKANGEFFPGKDSPLVFEWDPAGKGYLLRPLRGDPSKQFNGTTKTAGLTSARDASSRFEVKALALTGEFELHLPTGKHQWSTREDVGFEVTSVGVDAPGNDGPRVKFKILPQAIDGSQAIDGTVMIQSTESGRYVSVRADGVLETVKDGAGPRARFQLEPMPNGAYRIWSHAVGTVVYVDGRQRLATRGYSPRTNMDGDGFFLARAGVAPALAAFTHAPLKNTKSNLCAGASGGAGGSAKVEYCSDSASRRWSARNVGGGYFQLVDDETRLCLGVAGVDDHVADYPIDLYPCEPTLADPKLDSRWKLVGADSTPQLKNRVSGLCLDVRGPGTPYQTAGETALVVNACSADTDQIWRVKEDARRVTSVVPGEGYWGKWRESKYCPDGTWAHGFAIRVESDQGSGADDSALNSVRLVCADTFRATNTTVSSHDGWWGDWGATKSCPRGAFLVGASMSIEPELGSKGDDTTANDVKFVCSDGSDLGSTGGLDWGKWGPTAYCPANTRVCGLSIRLEDKQAGDADDTAMNGLELQCCAGPPRTTAGAPSTISAIRKRDVPVKTAVVVEGIAASGLITRGGKSGFFAVDRAGESGIWVFAGSRAVTVTAGDALTISGVYDEYKYNSEITLAGPDDLVKTGKVAVPTFPVVTAAEVATRDRAENYEGMCVTIKNARVNVAADTSGDFAVEGALMVSNRTSGATPAIDKTYAAITGCMEHAYDKRRLIPRNAGDLVELAK